MHLFQNLNIQQIKKIIFIWNEYFLERVYYTRINLKNKLLFGISPVRISFAGGGTDMPEYYDRFGGSVITTSINHFTYVIVNTRQDNKLQIFSSDFHTHNKPTTYEKLKPQPGTELAVSFLKFLKYKKGLNIMISSDVPPKSGLGSSSSLAVNLVNIISTLKNKNPNKTEIAEMSHHVERNIMKMPMGKQDEYISSYGGFNYIQFKKNKITVNPIKIKKKTLLELQQCLLLFFVGGRSNSKILSNQIKRIKNNSKETMDSLDTVKQLSEEMYSSLKQSNITSFGELLNKGWESKKKFSYGVSSKKIDKIYDSAIKHGAIGGKLTGAGGGGHLLLYADTTKHKKIIQQMTKSGLTQIKFKFTNEGAKVSNLYDYSSMK